MHRFIYIRKSPVGIFCHNQAANIDIYTQTYDTFHLIADFNAENTISSRSFQNTNVISTGISDCHKMIIKVISYRSYKNFYDNAFSRDLRDQVLNWGKLH